MTAPDPLLNVSSSYSSPMGPENCRSTECTSQVPPHFFPHSSTLALRKKLPSHAVAWLYHFTCLRLSCFSTSPPLSLVPAYFILDHRFSLITPCTFPRASGPSRLRLIPTGPSLMLTLHHAAPSSCSRTSLRSHTLVSIPFLIHYFPRQHYIYADKDVVWPQILAVDPMTTAILKMQIFEPGQLLESHDPPHDGATIANTEVIGKFKAQP